VVYGRGALPASAYSEFMPPPRLGRVPYGAIDPLLFSEDDPHGWRVSEIEEEYEIQPGLENLARQIVGEIRFGRRPAGLSHFGHEGENLLNNPYWPPELAARRRASRARNAMSSYCRWLSLERRTTWAAYAGHFFGGSEQGPERAFWKSFYSAPDQELPERESLAFILRLLSTVYGEVQSTRRNCTRLVSEFCLRSAMRGSLIGIKTRCQRGRSLISYTSTPR